MSAPSSDEALQDNAFLQELQNKHADSIYNKAASAGYVICVPKSESLSLAEFDEEFVAAHVLQASPYFKQEFVTLDGKSVVIRDNLVATKSGFESRRSARILFEELFYDDDYEKFRVLCISYPLLGPVPRDYVNAIRTKSSMQTAVERRDLQSHISFVQEALGGDDGLADRVIRACHTLARNFNNTYVLVKGFIAHAAEKVQTGCARILEEDTPGFIQEIDNRKARAEAQAAYEAMSQSMRDELTVAVESIVMSQIHVKIFTGLCELTTSEDARLDTLLARLSRLSAEQIGVRFVSTSASKAEAFSPHRAVEKLSSINALSTPVEKMVCLKDATEALMQAAAQLNKANNQKKQAKASANNPSASAADLTEPEADAISTDDLLPMLMYALAQTKKRKLHWISNLQYMKVFKPKIEGLDELDFHLANLEVALGYIQSGKLGIKSPSKEAPARMRGSARSKSASVQPRRRSSLTAAQIQTRQPGRRRGPPQSHPMRPGQPRRRVPVHRAAVRTRPGVPGQAAPSRTAIPGAQPVARVSRGPDHIHVGKLQVNQPDRRPPPPSGPPPPHARAAPSAGARSGSAPPRQQNDFGDFLTRLKSSGDDVVTGHRG